MWRQTRCHILILKLVRVKMDFYDFQYKMVTSYSQGKSPRLEKRKAKKEFD